MHAQTYLSLLGSIFGLLWDIRSSGDLVGRLSYGPYDGAFLWHSMVACRAYQLDLPSQLLIQAGICKESSIRFHVSSGECRSGLWPIFFCTRLAITIPMSFVGSGDKVLCRHHIDLHLRQLQEGSYHRVSFTQALYTW